MPIQNDQAPNLDSLASILRIRRPLVRSRLVKSRLCLAYDGPSYSQDSAPARCDTPFWHLPVGEFPQDNCPTDNRPLETHSLPRRLVAVAQWLLRTCPAIRSGGPC